jgi:hypothetical protein
VYGRIPLIHLLIIQNLMSIVASFAFHKKIASEMKQADIRSMFEKGLQECLYVNHFGIS